MGLDTNEHSAEEIERAILEVGFVEAVRVVVSDGAINEIHVLAKSGRGPKLLVRDIESVLMARFFIPVDHKKISIAQLGENENADRLANAGYEGSGNVHSNFANRITISAINIDLTENRLIAKVTLKFDNEEFVGTAKGINTHTSKIKLLAQAGLYSVSEITPSFSHSTVEDVQVLSMGSKKVAVVCISQLRPYGEDAISGSAVLKHDEKDCVVKAVLDAVNRRFTSPDLTLH